ncbi:lipopolysaccharide heptosyltransferase II [Dictyobacter kobayashii]|uniref:lipopolysaccharide heptosyltransferase II n=1 Tax=Dictyobacter kobayashii TaxID=2014872 RepID=A0A402AM04_9CHLR|nr:lipopolysaccharide heptosyltransferase II [Dictyobacter kobayashii]GCE20191.1 ADP-heptose--LPS heptosyltransferase [Dictyobacter kobayashii]
MAHALQNRDEYGYPTRPDSRRQVRNSVVHTSKRILLSTIYILMSLFGLFLRINQGKSKATPLDPQHFHPRRILVIRLDLIGDLVLSLPVVRILKRTYPEAEIDLLALPSSARVLGNDPDIQTVLTYDPNIWRRPKGLLNPKNWREARALRQRLHARNYDLAISVFGPWAALLSLLSGARRRVGFGQESYPGLMTDNVAGQHWNPDDHLHEVDYCLRLAQAAGATLQPEDRTPTLFVDQQARQEIASLLQQEGIKSEKILIACHVSSNNGQSKRWPIPYWARLIDQLLQSGKVEVIFTGAPDDLPLIAAITARMKEQAVNLAGKTSLAQLAALLQRADIVLTGDSGPMHIACAVGSHVVAIHGPTDPALSGPVSPKATILRDPIWCSPCYKAKGAPADCRFFTTQCMKNISPEQVLQAIHEIQLSQSSESQLEETRSSLGKAHSMEGILNEQDLS